MDIRDGQIFLNQYINFKRSDCLDPCVVIIGERPNIPRKNVDIYRALHGTRSADLIETIVKDINRPTILTNMINYYIKKRKLSKKDIVKAYEELHELVDMNQVVGFILLGRFSQRHFIEFCKEYYGYTLTHVFIYHPSYIIRFNKDIKEYATMINSFYGKVMS